MNILILGSKNEELARILKDDGHRIMEIETPVEVQFLKQSNIDFAISYGYRHIISSEVLNHMKDRIINMHISYLPWNKGADPNLWSFLEDTPKGVTIHYMDAGIDTGDIIAQKELIFDQDCQTLATTYDQLQKEMILLFKETWPLVDIEGGGTPRRRQPLGGTVHRISDKRYFKRLLARGWRTPVSEILGKGNFYLREVGTADKDMIRQWRNSPDVARYMYTDHQITEAEHEQWFQNVLKDQKRKYWIIVYERKSIGLANLYDIDDKNRRCFWGLYISSENVRSKGMGGFIEYQVMKYVFDNLEYNKLCCEALSSNTRAINLYKSFGFQEEGVYRRHILKNGEYTDVVALGMLKSEWDEKKSQIEARLKDKGLL